MIPFVENLKESPIGLINKCNKVSRYNISVHKSVFPYSNNQKEINRNNSVFDSIQKNKILMDKLSLGGKNLGH